MLEAIATMIYTAYKWQYGTEYTRTHTEQQNVVGDMAEVTTEPNRNDNKVSRIVDCLHSRLCSSSYIWLASLLLLLLCICYFDRTKQIRIENVFLCQWLPQPLYTHRDIYCNIYTEDTRNKLPLTGPVIFAIEYFGWCAHECESLFAENSCTWPQWIWLQLMTTHNITFDATKHHFYSDTCALC